MARNEHAGAYLRNIEEKTASVIEAGAPLRLEDCIRVALQHNLDVTTVEIGARIATLERRTAFANFLPTLDIHLSYAAWDRQPMSQMLGPFAVPMHDQTLRDITWQVQMPVFVPATWFLYAMRERGEEIASLVAEYTRQMVVLQVTVQYFHCLSLDEAERTMASGVEAATALHKELAAFCAEGMVSEWQADQAEALLLARSAMLHQTQRARTEAKAELLGMMGLSPLGDVSLVPGTVLQAPSGSLEDLILQALLANPQLHIADREVAIQHEAVKLAIADFLPQLLGFAGRTNTSNSFTKYRNYWTTGLTGILSVFDGFANIHQYQAAREREQAAYLRREEVCLAVMLEVIRAHLNLQNAREQLDVAKKVFDAAADRLAEVEAQWREGLVNPSTRLEVQAERDKEQMEVMNARFQEQVGTASLLNVLGAGYAGYETLDYEAKF
jgi:outer membrane protein TolC